MHRRLIPLVIALLTFAVFAPALWYGFIQWDDDRNLLDNPHYRGVGWSQLRWAFTSALMGLWTPVTWLTFGIDYALWGMNATGYHLTNVLLHAANAVLFYLVALRLLRLALTAAGAGALTLGAAAAALFFALHPLRVESVAWVTERRDVLSAFFWFLTVLFYLKMCGAEGPGRARWRLVSMVAYGLGLLSKSLIISLPFVLLVLDVYPLRRARGRWRQVLIEKLPYVVMAVVTAAISLSVLTAELGLTSTAAYPPAARAAVVFYSLTFYPVKTLLPLDLSPMYEVPTRIGLSSPPFLASAMVAVTMTIALFVARRRWPAGLAIWIVYGLTLAPVSGIIHAGPQVVVLDRYSYLSCLGWAVLLGAGVTAVASGRPRIVTPALARAAVGIVAAWIVTLAVLTQDQLPIWRDAEEIWRRALDVDPDCAFCHGQWGALLGNRGELGPAIEHFARVVALRPDQVRHRGNLGLALLRAGRAAEAAVNFELMLRDQPTDAETRNRLGLALVQQEKLVEASEAFRRAVRDDPKHVAALTHLGQSLADLGRAAEAAPHLERAVALDPASPAARFALARAYLALGRAGEAEEQRRVLRGLDPRLADELGRR